ncbi:hypothetical protein [Paenibacillus tepidiphilus]|uniref:hypothetical protein n=1 Tax=Paenibacillus tepidiphilus TaxID=2608683 RepID=UPI0013A5AE4F|nr:hypothetical protein [Paenibacillus tepidiphilus]
MAEESKKLTLKRNDVQIVDGKVILNNTDLAHVFEEESFLVDSTEGQEGISLTISKT